MGFPLERFTEQEKAMLAPFFSNLDKGVFVLTNLPEVVKGALFSRYSRSDKPLRRLLLDEFINDKASGFADIASGSRGAGESRIVATQKAEEFYDRVLVGYGDDSVAELGGCHIACEGVSNIAAKALEDSRLGISPLEKSTRYVYFDKKAEGHYLYHLERNIMASRHADLYTQTCDSLFESYAKWIEPMKKYLVEKFPKGEETERAYNSSIKAKACDILRGYLPAATLTNVGLFGNGRALEYTLVKMYSSELGEIRALAGEMHAELSKVIPSFVKRARGEFGDPTIKFMAETRTGMQKLADSEFVPDALGNTQLVTMTSYDRDAEEKAIAAALYPFTSLAMAQVRERVRKMGAQERSGVLAEYLSRRQNRRHKPGRGFEHTSYEFDVLMNFASYRDLHRHRVMTQQRQDITVRHGYDAPAELAEIGADSDFAEKMGMAADAYSAIHEDMGKEAQYIVPFAYRVRYSCCLNLRELYHLVELRSTIHGHPDYRRVVLKMLEEVKSVHPSLVEHMRFVDFREAGLERLQSEKMTDKKLAELKEKYG
ncbi:MAG: FAD-dependent thymidylate synthase [Candidatus Diapherotrites archaeon]|uniref:FAD-dependent thymidylate synthase n=1 Tax=Candidatus Iainarchaeum sp. TaxID=3101447 RepID=A0A8T3YMG5_9ARCH|nr:FAD-dependent thymidylate synthase [Candidatus Diapherotrites archaeon]